MSTPEFIQDEDFKVTLWRPESETEQATEQADAKIIRLIQVLDTPKTTMDIQTSLNLKHRPTLFYDYLRPAIDGGFVTQSHPDKPTHPNQTYSLTEKGQKFVQ